MVKKVTRITCRRIAPGFFLLALLVIFQACKSTPSKIDDAAYRDEINRWKERRLQGLMREDGWLSLCGLFWLKEGENKFGSDSSNAIVFPTGKAPKVAGSLWMEKGTVRLRAPKNSGIKHKDSVVTSLTLQSDREGLGKPTILQLGTLSFYVIERGKQLAIRVKDKENPERLNFKGLEYFPVDQKWRAEAKFEPYDPPRVIPIPTIINTVEYDSCPGALVFTLDGKTHRLDAVIERGSEDKLFIMFFDETNGKETYRLGRQLYSALPDSNNKVILDFNKAYNWPCVFTEYATCPIPPSQNRLAVRIEAGEKMYAGGVH